MQKFGYLLGLGAVHGLTGQLHQVGSQLVLVFVDEVLFLLNLVVFLLGEILQKGEGTAQILAGLFGHAVHSGMALGDSQGRVSQETLLQQIEVCLILQLLRVILHKPEDEFLDESDKGHQYQNGRHTEHGVHKRDGHRPHSHIHEREMHESIDRVEYNGPENHTEQVVQQIDQGSTLTVLIGSDGREKHRTCRADADTHGNRKSRRKADAAGHGQGLQDTDGSGRALQHGGESDTHQNTHERVLKGGQQIDEVGTLL